MTPRLRGGARAMAGMLVIAWMIGAAGPALGAEPSASPLIGDPRSPGEGPGLVGDPLFAVAAVVAIALVAVVATTLWVRATGHRERRR